MKITKIISVTMMGISLVTCMPQTTQAVNVQTTLSTVEEVAKMPKFNQVWGSIKEKDEKRIYIQNSSNVNNDIILNLPENLVIIDAVSGLPVSLKDINLNDNIYAYTSPIMTMSLPPISTAEALIVNIPQDFRVPSYIEVGSIDKHDDGSITVTSDDGLVEATLDSNTNTFPYLTKNIVTLDNIKIGSKLFLWNEIENTNTVNEESVEKVKVNKCLIMPYSYSHLIKASIDNLNIDGNKLCFSKNEKPFIQGKTLMVPLKVIAETCGYKYVLDNNNSKVTMTKEGAKTYSVTINSEMLNLEDTNYYLREKTIIKDNTIFVSADLFNLAQNAKIVE